MKAATNLVSHVHPAPGITSSTCKTAVCRISDFYVSEINHPRHHAMVAGSFVLEGDVSICGLDKNIGIGRIVYLVVNYHFPVKPMRCMVTLNNYPAIVPLTGRSKRLVGRRNIP